MYWAIIRPLSTPGSSARNGGSPWLRAASRKRSVRRSLMAATSATTMASRSKAWASGAPWKLPTDSIRPSARTTGLSMADAQLAVGARLAERERIAGGAVDLGGTAQRVGVLHPRVAGAVRRHDGRAGQQRGEVGGRGLLPDLGPQRHEVGGEGAVGAEQALDAHRRGDVGRPQQVGQVDAGQHEHAQHPVGAVDERQPLLGLERKVERGGDVRQRGEIAAAAQGAELGHLGQGIPVEQASSAAASSGRAPVMPVASVRARSSDHRPHDLGLDRVAEPGGVRGDQRPLGRSRRSGGMAVVARPPNPVETP